MLTDRIGGWMDERLGVGKTLKGLLHKPIRGGARYIFSLGFLNLFLLTNQFVTGLFLMIYYAPTPDHAYEAVKFIQNDLPFGYMVRGLHYWGASAMVVSVMLHALRVFVFGAYKKPREMMWLSGVVMLLLVFGFAFTGYLLPWDQKSYWATVVGTNVGGTAPVAGQYVVRLLRGGADITALTLTRFFAVHTILLPWLIVALAGFHLSVLQLVGHVGHFDPEKARVTDPFYPNQVFKDATIALGVFALLMFFATVSPAGLEAIADPTDHSYNPRPEWYFFFLFQLLHYMEGPFEVVGTVILPSLFVGVLLAIPFIDRRPVRIPRQRPVAIGGAAAVAAGYLALTLLAVVSPPGGVTASVPETRAVTEGRMLFQKLGCNSCHAIHGVGGEVGPELTHVGSRLERGYMKEFVKDPKKFRPGIVMPGYGYLSDEELDRLADYLASLK